MASINSTTIKRSKKISVNRESNLGNFMVVPILSLTIIFYKKSRTFYILHEDLLMKEESLNVVEFQFFLTP